MAGNIRPYYHKVQCYETDMMQMVHHSNYICWFEEARLDYLEQAHFPYVEIEVSGIPPCFHQTSGAGLV